MEKFHNKMLVFAQTLMFDSPRNSQRGGSEAVAAPSAFVGAKKAFRITFAGDGSFLHKLNEPRDAKASPGIARDFQFAEISKGLEVLDANAIQTIIRNVEGNEVRQFIEDPIGNAGNSISR